MTRGKIMAVAFFSVALIGTLWLVNRTSITPPADPGQDSMINMPGIEQAPVRRTEIPGTSGSPPLSPQSSALSVDPTGTVSIPPERLQAIGVKYDEVIRRPLEKVIRTVGRVAVDERRLAKVTIKFHGWIEKLLVSAVGDQVAKGQVLFTIYSPDLVATQEEYLLALESRRQLGESEFQEVSRGSKDLLESTRHRFHLWDINEEHIRELERTGKVLKTLPIHSPITGTVIRKEVLQGAHVEPGEELYTIADLSRLWILADIYEYELGFVKKRQQAEVSLSYDPSTVLTGRVGFIYPTLDPKTRTAKVRFEVENPNEKLKPDMYANVELRANLGIRLVVPVEAVIESGQKQLVFLHHGGGRLEPRLIKAGLRTDKFYEVIEGLKEKDHVVTSANFLIDSESRLKTVVESMSGMPEMK